MRSETRLRCRCLRLSPSAPCWLYRGRHCLRSFPVLWACRVGQPGYCAAFVITKFLLTDQVIGTFLCFSFQPRVDKTWERDHAIRHLIMPPNCPMMATAMVLLGVAYAEAGGCSFQQNTDCDGVVTPPGFLRNWGTTAAGRGLPFRSSHDAFEVCDQRPFSSLPI